MPLTRALILSLIASPVLAAPPKVVTDIPPVHSLAASVMGDLSTPQILLDRGGDPHNFQLKPSQARALSQADLVFWVGPKLTPWLDRAIHGVEIPGESVELIEAPGTYRREFGAEEDHDHEHAHEAGEEAHAEEHHDAEDHDEHDHEEHAEHDHDEHAEEHADGMEGHDEDEHHHHHEGLDPHAWLDPENARVWTLQIAAKLAAHDPENAAVYEANADATIAAISEAEAEVKALLAPVGDAPIMVFHEAYGYFSAHFGVNVAGAIAAGDAANPGAGHLRELQEELEHEGVVCIFPEAQHDPAYVNAIVEGTETRVGQKLDPSGSTLDYGPGLYTRLLTTIAGTIAACVTGADG